MCESMCNSVYVIHMLDNDCFEHIEVCECVYGRVFVRV